MACSNASVRTGSKGKVEADDVVIARLKQWSITDTVEQSAWGDSDSAGYTNRVSGRRDATGSMTGVFDNDDPVYDLFAPGDTVQLVLFEWDSPLSYWVFPCVLVTNYSVTYNMDTKEAVEWSADWGADGIFYRPGQAGAPAHTYPV
jgi:hypothetical protein